MYIYIYMNIYIQSGTSLLRLSLLLLVCCLAFKRAASQRGHPHKFVMSLGLYLYSFSRTDTNNVIGNKTYIKSEFFPGGNIC